MFRKTVAGCLVVALAAGAVWSFWDRIAPGLQTEAGAKAAEERFARLRDVEARAKEDDARTKLAFVSLVDRLPKGKPIAPSRPLDASSKKRWGEIEQSVAFQNKYRAELLQGLHEKTTRFFLESPSNGSGRNWRPDPDAILLAEHSEPVADQPGAPADFPLSPGEELRRVAPDDDFFKMHFYGSVFFSHPSGLGYVKDREHVAGFRSHGFSHPPVDGTEKSWKIDHVQLVGILTHETPRVYLTDKLPSMDQVRQGKTRELDFFEEVALPKLCEGEDLHIVQKNDTIRMLGALRATKTCQKCHEAEIGDMLGAFSYTLRPGPKAEQTKK